jgi:hypothetical protein
MNYAKCFAILSALAFLLSPASLFARDKNQHTVNIPDPVQVGSAHLNAGDYKVEWQGTGPAVQVKFLKDGAVVATVPATIKSDPQVRQDDVVLRNTGANSKALEEIDLAHQKEAIVLGKG